MFSCIQCGTVQLMCNDNWAMICDLCGKDFYEINVFRVHILKHLPWYVHDEGSYMPTFETILQPIPEYRNAPLDLLNRNGSHLSETVDNNFFSNVSNPLNSVCEFENIYATPSTNNANGSQITRVHTNQLEIRQRINEQENLRLKVADMSKVSAKMKYFVCNVCQRTLSSST